MTNPDDPSAANWLKRLSRHGGTGLRWAMALPILGGALLVGQAWLLAGVLHRAIVSDMPLAQLTPAIAALAAILLLRIGIGALAEWLANRSAESVKLRLRQALFADLLARPPLWTISRSSGALSGLLLEQVEALHGYLARYLPAMVQAAILPIVFAAIVFPIDWVVGLLFLVTAPLIPVFMALAGWGAEAASKAQAEALSRLGGRFADRLRGLTTLKLFGHEEVETAGVRIASEELRHRTMRVMRIAFLSSAVLEFFAALGVAGVALYVGLTFLDLVSLRGGSELTLEAGMFCLLLAPELCQPLRLLAAHYHDRAAAKAAVEEIADIAEALPQLEATAPAVARPRIASGAVRLQLEDVAVATPGGRPVLEAVGLEIAPGEHIAILGTSGIGKSTLLEAVARLRAFRGLIRLDGRSLAELPEPILRQRTAMLSQRPRLFAGSIADNIRLGRRDADADQVRAAAVRAHVTDFADALPDGLSTRLGENGIGLSGGEVQRVALARLYLRDPGLILLDEPTAHLDAATEAGVLDGILAFAASRSLLVATHSPAVAARMDHVFRIAGGRLLRAPKPPGAIERGVA